MKNRSQYHSHSHSHKHTVTEHRAPTDESIRLLDGFRKEAMNNVVATYKLEQNNLSAMVFYIQHDVTAEVHMHLRFKLNLKEYYLKESMGYWEFSEAVSHFTKPYGNQEGYRFWMETLGKAISLELMKGDDFTATILENKRF